MRYLFTIKNIIRKKKHAGKEKTFVYDGFKINDQETDDGYGMRETAR